MNFQFFAFMVFISISSFAVAFLAYAFLTKFLGKDSRKSRFAQIFLVPAFIIVYDLVTVTAPAEYTYLVGSLPLAAVIGLLLYSYLYKGKDAANDVETKKNTPIRNEAKTYSKKSARIHAARQKRGRE